VLGDYLESLRDIERRIERIDAPAACEREPGTDDQGPRTEDQGLQESDFIERLSLIFDLTALAFRADVTRVASVMMAAECSTMTYRHLGATESFHALSHHRNEPERLEPLVRIQTFHTQMFAKFASALAEMPDGDGSMLDHSHIVYGSNMSDSQRHDHYPLPLAVLGPQSTVLSPRFSAPDSAPTPMSSVLLSLIRGAGVPLSSVGDSTGAREGI
jgi:hypothetical protein